MGNLVTVAEPGCLEPGRALGTEPGAGAAADPSDPVRLTVARDDPGANCALVDRAVLVAPRLRPRRQAAGVRRRGDHLARRRRVDRDRPGDLAHLGVGLARSRRCSPSPTTRTRRATGVDDAPSASAAPTLSSRPSAPSTAASGARSARRARRTAPRSQAWFAYQRDGEIRACSWSTSRTDEQGRIDALAVRTAGPRRPPARPRRRAGERGGLATSSSALVAFATGECDRAAGSRRRGPPLRRGGVPPHGVRRRADRPQRVAGLRTRGRGITCDGTALEQVAYAVGEVPFRSSSQVPVRRAAGTVDGPDGGPAEGHQLPAPRRRHALPRRRPRHRRCRLRPRRLRAPLRRGGPGAARVSSVSYCASP